MFEGGKSLPSGKQIAAPRTEPIAAFLTRHWSDPGTDLQLQKKAKETKQAH